MSRSRKIVAVGLALLLAVGFSLAATGQGEAAQPAGGAAAPKVVFPEKGKTVRMIITHGVGGSVDLPARAIAPYVEKILGVTIVPENMEGAGGRRAMEFAFAAPPDGYTIVVSAFPSRLIGELLYPESKFKMKDFVHLGSWLGGDYRTVIVANNAPYQTFADLMEASRTKTLKASGGGGLGSTSQLQTVFLTQKMGMNADFIPYESSAEMVSAVIGGHVDFGLSQISSSARYAQQGDVRILAIHAPKRHTIIPDVPTLEELGYKGVVIPYGVGAWAPPGTPKEIQQKYGEAILKACQDPEFLAWAEKTKTLLEPQGPEEFLQTTMADYENINAVLDLLKTAK
jgi:tripartite-type tricarboxylate transporter receptor subunit TctC